ncbi:hypothetical protein [Niveibacterium terrae]|uniref:hypothetical protein n=1 Tax=Niveibacterium terrae TaxID=3373598 RepID=UPI003A9402E9
MPFIRRAPDGAILALLGEAENGADEFLPGNHPEVLRFLGQKEGQTFNALDADFIRVLEDLIDALIAKGVLRVTDLPHEAQRKLAARKGLRNRLKDALDLLGSHDVI